jgi:hypothetical protein
LAAVAVFTFITNWNEFLLNLVLTSTHTARTMPVALALLNTEYGVRWDYLSAAGVTLDLGFSQNGGHGHGGPLEMAAADAANPGTVDWAAAQDLDVTELPGKRIVRALHEGRPLPNWAGYHGWASEGSLAKGALLLDRAAERIVRLARDWLFELAAAQSRQLHTSAA